MRNRIWLLALAVVAIGIGAAVSVMLQRPAAPEIASGTLLDSPRPVADFALEGSDGKPFDNASLRGHWNLLFAGYTFCPDVCPTTLAELKSVMGLLGADASQMKFTFISIDPGRDTLERLAQYVHYFSPDFQAATGSNEALENLGKSLGFVFVKIPGASPESYLMDHSAALMLVDPQGRLAGYLTPPFKAQQMAADLKRIIARGA